MYYKAYLKRNDQHANNKKPFRGVRAHFLLCCVSVPCCPEESLRHGQLAASKLRVGRRVLLLKRNREVFAFVLSKYTYSRKNRFFIVEITAGKSLCYCKLKSSPSLPSPIEIFIPRMKIFIKTAF